MTTQQALTILGQPKEECNLYAFTEEQTGRICFSKGAMASKDIVVAPPPAPIVHHWNCRSMAFFAQGSPALTPQGQQGLRVFLEGCRFATERSSGISIVVEGHTDASGDSQVNMTLSLARARAIRNYLISLGVAAASIEVKGYGDTKLLVPTSDPEPQNRRGEVFVRRDGKILSFL